MKAIRPGLKFVLNAEKPTKGVFIVRTDKGEVIWSMTGLTRPFQPLKVRACVGWWWIVKEVGQLGFVCVDVSGNSFEFIFVKHRKQSF